MQNTRVLLGGFTDRGKLTCTVNDFVDGESVLNVSVDGKMQCSIIFRDAREIECIAEAITNALIDQAAERGEITEALPTVTVEQAEAEDGILLP